MTLAEAERKFADGEWQLGQLRDSRRTLRSRREALMGRRSRLIVDINNQPDPLIQTEFQEEFDRVEAELTLVSNHLSQCEANIVAVQRKFTEARNALNEARVAAGLAPLPEPVLVH